MLLSTCRLFMRKWLVDMWFWSNGLSADDIESGPQSLKHQDNMSQNRGTRGIYNTNIIMSHNTNFEVEIKKHLNI